MDLSRLFHPRSVAVVGATDSGDRYGSQTLLNLAAVGFEGDVWGVNPRRTEAHGVPCFPTLADLPGVPDAVVVAVPAAGVPAVIEAAGALGCGGAVVFAAGFREADRSAALGTAPDGATLEAQLRAAALRHALPVCGPNCDGLIALHTRAALWGDALAPVQEPGHVALVSQSGNLAVNALATRRGLRLHTAISSGNETVLTTPDYLEHLAGEPDVRSVALLIEDDGDGARLCDALAACADAGVAVAVLKVGASAVGAAAAAAHTGALAGDHRIFRALVEEAGAAWATDPHALLELAKALAVRGARPRGRGLAILTCSGGDSGLGADEADRLGVHLPAFAPATAAALREQIPATATIANPLDYTAMIWGDRAWQRDLVALVGADPGIDQVLVFYDHPHDLAGSSGESWQAVEDGLLDGAEASPAAVLVAATLPELLDDAAAWRFAQAGVPAVAGLRTGLACAAALQAPPADAPRLRAIAAACRASGRVTAQTVTAGTATSAPAGPGSAGPVCDIPSPGRSGPASPGRWLAEHETKALLRAAGIPVVDGRIVAGEDDAVAALAELGGPVAVKLSSPRLQHKGAAGALVLDVAAEPALRAVHRTLTARNGGAEVLVERMAPPGAELIVAVRRDAVVPALVIGLGGIYAEAFDDVAVVPLPATPERVQTALAQLRGAALLAGADLPAAARLAASLAELPGLELIECNPVLVHENGAVVVDAIARAYPGNRDRPQGEPEMNAIAKQLGEVGLPAPVKELAARDWDAIVVGGGHNGLTCAAYLARAGQSVLVLERRERLGGACTLERPFSDPDYIVSPCAYVVGLLDDIVIQELALKRRGLHVHIADPNLWVPFEDGTAFGQWVDDARTQADLDALKVSKQDQEGYWAYEHLFDEMRRRLRTGERDSWLGDSPSRAELEELLQGEQTMLDVLFDASIAEVLDDHMTDQRLKDALFGQGVIGAWAGPKDKGTASIKLMHYQGDLEGRGPLWGYVRGGMGMISFAIADAAQEAGATLATGVPVAEIVPDEGVRLEDGTLIRAATVVCNADPKVALRLLGGHDVPAPFKHRLEAWQIRSPVVKFNSALHRLPTWTAAPGEDFPARGTVDVTTGLDAAQLAFESCARGEPAVGFGEIYVQTVHDPTPAPRGKHLLSVFGQYAPYDFDWDNRRDEVGRQFIDLISRFAPDFEDCLEHHEVLGPPDIEARIGLTGGNIFQGETMPDQMWEHRLSARTPLPGLYLCGAATHPAGSVIALNGRNAAMAVLEDARAGAALA